MESLIFKNLLHFQDVVGCYFSRHLSTVIERNSASVKVTLTLRRKQGLDDMLIRTHLFENRLKG